MGWRVGGKNDWINLVSLWTRISRYLDFEESVYKSVSISYGVHGTDEQVLITSRENQSAHSNIDSIINTLKNEPQRILIEISRFYLALDSLQSSDCLISYVVILALQTNKIYKQTIYTN